MTYEEIKNKFEELPTRFRLHLRIWQMILFMV